MPEDTHMLQLSRMKVEQEDLAFEIDLVLTEDKTFIAKELQKIEETIQINASQIDAIDEKIKTHTNQADTLDYSIAVASGVIAGGIDSLWVGSFDFEAGKKWSNQTVNAFVMRTAKATGYKPTDGGRLDGAIKHLEDKFKIPSDHVFQGKKAGISSCSHHLDDLAHHPTLLGLLASILTQFTEKTYFQNRQGTSFDFDVENKKLIGRTIPAKFFAGTVMWAFHLISDMSGSKKTAGVGMGIPGPIVSLLKEVALIPGINKTNLPQKVHEIFVKERFDLRSELAVAHELGKQAVPVLMNEVLVRAFYFLRRLIGQVKLHQGFVGIDWKATIPFKNRTIVRMLTIATTTFTAIDLGDAAIRAGLQSGGELAVFTSQFLLRVNFVGVGRCVMAIGTDAYIGAKKESLRNDRMKVMTEQAYLYNAKVYYLQSDMWIEAKNTATALEEISRTMEKSTQLYMQIEKANKISLGQISTFYEEVQEQNPGLIDDISDVLKWG